MDRKLKYGIIIAAVIEALVLIPVILHTIFY